MVNAIPWINGLPVDVVRCESWPGRCRGRKLHGGGTWSWWGTTGREADVAAGKQGSSTERKAAAKPRPLETGAAPHSIAATAETAHFSFHAARLWLVQHSGLLLRQRYLIAPKKKLEEEADRIPL